MESQDLTDFINQFYAYGKLISNYSTYGESLLKKIDEKKVEFNKLSESERIQFMNSDPDFLSLKDTMKKLQSYYAAFYNFINEGMKIPDNLVEKTVQNKSSVSAPASKESAD
jgi:hypothetical protein